MLAQDFDAILNKANINPKFTPGTSKVSNIISDILPYVFGAAGLILLFNIVVSGYQMIFSKGDPKAMQAAQSKITSSLIGVLLLFLSFYIIRLFGSVFDIVIFRDVIR